MKACATTAALIDAASAPYRAVDLFGYFRLAEVAWGPGVYGDSP